MDLESDELTDAERRLVDAARTGKRCDFAEGAKIDPAEMRSWGVKRAIRAEVLHSLLSSGSVELRGAVITASLTWRRQGSGRLLCRSA